MISKDKKTKIEVENGKVFILRNNNKSIMEEKSKINKKELAKLGKLALFTYTITEVFKSTSISLTKIILKIIDLINNTINQVVKLIIVLLKISLWTFSISTIIYLIYKFIKYLN